MPSAQNTVPYDQGEILVRLQGDLARRLGRVARDTAVPAETIAALVVRQYLDQVLPPHAVHAVGSPSPPRTSVRRRRR